MNINLADESDAVCAAALQPYVYDGLADFRNGRDDVLPTVHHLAAPYG